MIRTMTNINFTRIPKSKFFLYSIYLIISSYVVTEIIFTFAIVKGYLKTQQQEICMVDTGKPVSFNSVTGYSISQTTTPFAQFSENKVVYVSEFQGNSDGFLDSCEFTRQRTEPGEIRVGVFGDSFTSAPYLMTNFTERCEDLFLRDGRNLNLMNFGVDGSGIATWWSIVTRYLKKENFELDLLIFAVYGDDLDRSFHMRDTYSGYIWNGYEPILHEMPWDIEKWPKSPDEARNRMYRDAMLVTQERFNQAVSEKRFLPVRPYLAKFIRTTFQYMQLIFHLSLAKKDQNEAVKLRMWDDIAKYADEMNIPVIVVRIPDEFLLQNPSESPDIVKFANHIGASYWDGVEAFPKVNAPDGYSKYFLYNDNHWNQQGSDLFAGYLFQELAAYLHHWHRGGIHPPAPALAD